MDTVPAGIIIKMRQRPEAPSSIRDRNSIDFLLYELGRQAREGDGTKPAEFQELRHMLREQLSKSHPVPSAYIEGLLASLDDKDITPELLWHALTIPKYAPAAENGAFRPEDYVDGESA